MDSAPAQPSVDPAARTGRHWLLYVVPFIVYMLLNTLEPTPPKPAVNQPEHAAKPEKGGWFTLGIPYSYYPVVYSAKVGITALLMLALAREYRQLPWRVSPLAGAVGAVGVVLWVGICLLELEPRILGPLGLDSVLGTGERAAFNPLAQLKDQPALAYGFLAVRFLGLVLIVPIIEELFLRGFLMRFITDSDWWQVPIAGITTTAVAITTAAAMAMHPAELLAELAWFSSVTWLMFRTKNLTDCIVAHAVTNLLLGIYVVTTGNWRFM